MEFAGLEPEKDAAKRAVKEQTRPARKIGPAAVFFLSFFLAAVRSPARPGPAETSRQFVLDNGLRVFLLEKRNIPLISVVAAVNLGTKDETAETSGLVHLLEHYVLFRGTKSRSGSEVSRDVRVHGGHFNAHTGQDLVLFEITVPAENAEFALINQKEILFDLKPTQEDLDREKSVILEEFNHLEDDPFLHATSAAYQNLFGRHPYANPPLGNPEVIRGLTAEKVEEFYRKFCVPANCSLAAVGDFEGKAMEDSIRRIFGPVKAQPPPQRTFEPAQPPPKKVRTNIEMDVQKAYLVIAAFAPDYNSPDQYAFDILTEVLGRGVSPMIWEALRGRRRLVETVSVSYHAHRQGGAFLVYLTLDPRDLPAAEREATNFLRQAREKNFSPDDVQGLEQMLAFDFLGGAKNRIKYAAQTAQEKGLHLAMSLAQHLLLTDGQKDRGYLENIDRIRSGDLRQAAAKYLGQGNFSVVSVTPKKKRAS